MSQPSGPVRETPDGAVLTVWVVPGASRTELAGRHGDAIKVRVEAPPEGGRANRMVGEVVGRALGVERARVVTGLGSRRKGVLLPGTTKRDVRRRLESLGMEGRGYGS